MSSFRLMSASPAPKAPGIDLRPRTVSFGVEAGAIGSTELVAGQQRRQRSSDRSDSAVFDALPVRCQRPCGCHLPGHACAIALRNVEGAASRKQPFISLEAVSLEFRRPGEPECDSAICKPSSAAHCNNRVETNPGPLSERRNFGAPRSLISRLSTSTTRSERMLPATSIASASRVCSSITVRHLNC